jgi:hypothetical protein
MKKTLLMLALVAGITSFAQNATAALIYNASPGYSPSGTFFSTYNILFNPSTGAKGGFWLDQQIYTQVYFDGNFTDYPSFDGNFTDYPSYSFLSEYSGSSFSLASFSDVVNASFMTSSGGSSPLSLSDGTYYIAFDVEDRSSAPVISVYYGWMNVTVVGANANSNDPLITFTLNEYAYDNTGGSILVGQTAGAAPIPEPGTWAAMAIFAGGAAYAGWRRRKSAKVSE